MRVYRESPSIHFSFSLDMPSSFELQAKKLFLTYPQCDLPRDQLMQFLWEHPCLNEKDNNPVFIRVAQEKHEDGNLHLHALVVLEKKLRSRRPRFLDFEGHHGKYEACKNVYASMQYLLKEDEEYLDQGVFPSHYYPRLTQRLDHCCQCTKCIAMKSLLNQISC